MSYFWTRFRMISSSSHKVDCWDNAVAESFFATIKRDFINRCFWIIKKAVRDAVREYIEVFYNRKRKHSTNGIISLVENERLAINDAAVETRTGTVKMKKRRPDPIK